MNISKNEKKAIVILLIIIVLFYITTNTITYIRVKNEKQEIQNQFEEQAQNLGLTDVEVILNKQKARKYSVIIKCSNLETFSYEELIEIDKNINIEHSLIDFDYKYLCNYNLYEVYSSIYMVEKNGEIVYDDKNTRDAKNDYYNSLYNNTEIKVTDDDKGACWAVAKDAVRSKLKSPSSAKFPAYSVEGVSFSRKGDAFTVTGYVDAENSFGSTIRTSFEVTIELDGSKYVSKDCILFE